MLEHLQVHRQVLFDLTANYLDPLPGTFERLAYLAGLREVDSGKYVHTQLSKQYHPDVVDQVLARCHEEIFERLLEMPLSAQESNLRNVVGRFTGNFAEQVQHCRDVAPQWIPPNAPPYLIELYSSNVKALLELLPDNRTTAR